MCSCNDKTEFHRDDKGFMKPEIKGDDINFCDKICPASGKYTEYIDSDDIWGNWKEVFLGWSTDEYIRKTASSGGVITSICCYLLDNHIVDGIIQTKAAKDVVYRTETVISRSREDVLECMGSRYSASYPLYNLKKIIRDDEVYAFVGKPCDVSALRMYLKEDVALASHFKYLLSFFCAGVPGELAQKNLLKALDSGEDCVELRYRGNGWPGYATAKKSNGEEKAMTYAESWGNILGRDIKKSCRFCFDGVGDMADIACGDAWYMNDDGEPDFSEHDGRNVIFVRTDAGCELFDNILRSNAIEATDYREQLDDLKKIQKFQFERRATMKSALQALRISKKQGPHYSKKIMNKYSSKVSLRVRLGRFVGTVKRVKAGKI